MGRVASRYLQHGQWGQAAQPRANPSGRMRSATAPSTTIVSEPSMGLTWTLMRTCAAPRTTLDKARLTSDVPEIMASMNALVSQGTPMFGSTLDSGVINAPARHARPAPMAKLDKRTNALLTP